MSDNPTITSLQNPRIKELVRLRDRSGREARDLMLIEETRVIRRALRVGLKPSTLFVCAELLDREGETLFAELSRIHDLEIVHLSRPVIEKAAYRKTSDGLLLVAPRLHNSLQDLKLPENPLLLVLESVEKPGNLGAILRTANGAGVDAILVCGQSVDLCNPNVLRASTGAVFDTPTVAVETPEILDFLKERKIRIVATTPDSDRLYTDLDLRGPLAIVLGAEDRGLGADWLRAADQTALIPMHGNADSLNVSVSAAVLAYEATRQRRGGEAAPPPPR